MLSNSKDPVGFSVTGYNIRPSGYDAECQVIVVYSAAHLLIDSLMFVVRRPVLVIFVQPQVSVQRYGLVLFINIYVCIIYTGSVYLYVSVINKQMSMSLCSCSVCCNSSIV